MLYYFKKVKNATECKNKKICALQVEGADRPNVSKSGFVKFGAGDFLLSNEPQSVGQLMAIKSRYHEEDSCHSPNIQIIALKITCTSYVNYFDVWVPYK